VSIVGDRPSESVAYKTFSRLRRSLVSGIDGRYASRTIEDVRGDDYDQVLVVGGMSFSFPRERFLQLRRSLAGARFVAYLWDSIANSPVLRESLDLFDDVYSFDPEDCATHSELKLLPLFYRPEYELDSPENAMSCAYDACFVGSVHQVEKFSRVKSIVTQLQDEGRRCFTYYYMPSKSSLAYRRITSDVYRDSQVSDYQFQSLQESEVISIISSSFAVIDAPQELQKGLTMRTIEAIGAQRKLITTNKSIVNYDFYDPANVCVYRDNSSVDPSFFHERYHVLPAKVYKKYSLRSWTMTLLGDDEL
jgi:hypothetical protein